MTHSAPVVLGRLQEGLTARLQEFDDFGDAGLLLVNSVASLPSLQPGQKLSHNFSGCRDCLLDFREPPPLS